MTSCHAFPPQILSLLLALSLQIALAPSRAQAPAPRVVPSFAVATIKPSKSGYPGGGDMFFPGRFEAKNVSIKDLIKAAYGLRFGANDQIVGGPEWINSARFDVEAKEEQPLPDEVKKMNGYNRLEIQTLLADRFKLKVHHESRDLPVYELLVAKNGPKLTPSVSHPTSPGDENHTVAFGAVLPAQSQTGAWQGIRTVGRGSAKAQRETIGMFVPYFLQARPEIGNRLILDKTGLKGEYDFTLHWLPEGESPRDLALSPPEESWPPLFTALQEQLGLKLVSTKGPVDVIVIDSVEMPSEN